MTAPPALDWLHAEFEQNLECRRWKSRNRCFDEHWHGPSAIRPMIQLRSLLDSGKAMHVTQTDYLDPDRWWL